MIYLATIAGWAGCMSALALWNEKWVRKWKD
jgi:hypothetical protein